MNLAKIAVTLLLAGTCFAFEEKKKLRGLVATDEDYTGNVAGNKSNVEQVPFDEYLIVEVYSTAPTFTDESSRTEKENVGGANHGIDATTESRGIDADWEEHQDPDMERGKPAREQGSNETDGSPGMNVIVGGKDERFIFQDTSYPYRAVGRVSTGNSACTGTMVGRRLMLTARHCVNFLPGGGFSPLTFSPAYYDGDHPFYGKASASRVLSFSSPSGCQGYCYTAFDFVVVVLDNAIGDKSGYLGVKTFDEAWLGGKYWDNVGYPGDLGGTRKSVFFNDAAILKTRKYDSGNVVVLETDLDVNGGQSGSPMYGYWTSSGYYVVGVVTSHDGSDDPDEWNNSAGGKKLTDLVVWAREKYP